MKENGASIPVTMENRKEYVQLAAQYRLHSSIAKQIENLLAGFYEIVPKELISIVSLVMFKWVNTKPYFVIECEDFDQVERWVSHEFAKIVTDLR